MFGSFFLCRSFDMVMLTERPEKRVNVPGRLPIINIIYRQNVPHLPYL